ncbi:lipid A biosynthesis lauroyl acyltransferase [Aerophototrophica crusticola]|uniref:Lipid A biosynthesis lauroyl acyltransferase n=1 Tax=Aerophototrophica crusticola TaxID=1709002 RepID=A0A858R939_9PROT|nr:lipid A biosynthesis lauroyl acyltransferase [Rhodospirillaceae bacterium B3]
MANHSKARRRWDRTVGYRLEAAGLWLLLGLLRSLGIDRASAFGGWLARGFGPRSGASKKALRNIALAFPEMTPEQHRDILAGAWENFGRTMAEYVHLGTLAAEWDRRVELVGGEYLDQLAGDGRPGIAMTGHFANWELSALACARAGMELTFVFRQPNNPYAAALLAEARRPLGGTMVPKGREAARGLMTAIRKGGHVGLLVDQKLNEGIPVPFLGRDAMTGTVLADLALRYQAPVVPIRVVRLKGARFRVEVFPPLEFAKSGDMAADVRAVMGRVNDLLGDWVRAEPGQWLWQHRRWPD